MGMDYILKYNWHMWQDSLKEKLDIIFEDQQQRHPEKPKPRAKQ